jgi:hypothetical protein
MYCRPRTWLTPWRLATGLSLLLLGASATRAADAAKPSTEGIAFFEANIRPVLVEKCYACHSQQAKKLKGNLLVDNREGLLKGGDTGPAIVPCKPEESLLLEALRYESYEMPPSGKLPDAVIADFEKWIAIGAPDPRIGAAPVAATGTIDLEQGRQFWCFQPVKHHALPAVKNSSWPRGPIDHFLLAKLESHDLEPAKDADRATWLRRVTFDLIGLPPTIEELDAFINDTSTDAYEKVVDRLLASPHFGERWGRHWLDVARFAESSGGGRTLLFKDAWRYRDYVLNSVNTAKPVDQFLIEQIAGDLLPHNTPEAEREHLIATGYLILGAHNYEEQDKAALEMDVVDEQLDVIGRGLLGMTVTCARCHDHKFDPIPTADYYALAGILRSTHVLIHENVSKWVTRSLPMSDAERKAVKAHEAQVAAIKQKLKAAKEDGNSGKAKKKIAALTKQLKDLQARSPEPVAMAAEDAKQIEDCQICIRGSVHHRGATVPRGVLQVATTGDPPIMPADHSGRLELAQWIASPQNPLTARVYVNRVWHYLFGVGLVRTLDNFGTTGELPSHTELLDYLAERFMQEGWSTKKLVRELALSHAYRISTEFNDAAAAVDPENRLLWRMNRKRLDAESLRDAMLMASGRLDLTYGGQNMTKDVLEKVSAVVPAEYGYQFKDTRRSVYTPAFRNRMHELFEVFDFADQNRSVSQRNVTTVAPQALFMLNSPFVMEEAAAAAKRALADDDATDDQRITRAFREALGRAPSRRELTMARWAVHPAKANDGDSENGKLAGWEQLYQGLFGCVDFRYLD